MSDPTKDCKLGRCPFACEGYVTTCPYEGQQDVEVPTAVSHEPECPYSGNIVDYCMSCALLSAAYKRGLDNASEVAADLLQAFQERRITDVEFIEAIKRGGIFAARGGEQLEHYANCDSTKGCTCGTRTIITPQKEQE